MKKFNKIFSIMLGVFLTIGSSGIVAKASESSVDQSDTTKELMEKFPQYKESVLNNTTGKLAGSNEIYIKYTPKEQDSEVSYRSLTEETKYDKKICTKEEYLEETSPQITPRNVGGYEHQDSSWLKLNLQVYHANSTSEFMAYSFFEWKTTPMMTFTDGHGISTSSNLIIGRETSQTPILAEYRYGYLGMDDVVNTFRPKMNDRGVVAAFGLKRGAHRHMGMVMAPVNFTEHQGFHEGRIFNTYLHAQASMGGIGIDATGLPSLSLSISQDSNDGSVVVYNYI